MRAHDSKDADAAQRAHREIRRSPGTVPGSREQEQGRDAPMSPAAIFALQRSAGNVVVSRLLDQERESRAQAVPDGDHGAEASVQRDVEASVQRDVEASVQREIDVRAAIGRGGGRPLDPDVRSEMEARMGQAPGAFGPVRVVGGAEGEKLARQVGAKAFTSGSRIYGDVSDAHTLAHELTHVIQQSRGPVAGTDNGDGLKISDPADPFEREAEANATRVLSAPAPARPADERADQREAPVQRARSAGHPVQRAPSTPQKGSRTESPAPAASPARRLFGNLAHRPASPSRSADASPSRLKKKAKVTVLDGRSQIINEHLSEEHLEMLLPLLEEISQGDVDIKQVEAGKHPEEWAIRKIEFNGWPPALLSEHVRQLLENKKPASKAFDVRSRAENVEKRDGFIFTDDAEARRIANIINGPKKKGEKEEKGLHIGNYDLGERILAEKNSKKEDWPKDLATFLSMIEKEGWKPRVENKNPKMIYYGPELSDRAPHPSPAKLPSRIAAPPRPTTTELHREFEIKGPCRRGDSSKTRAGAMENYSALNYAKAVGYPDADKMRWEWLHLIGSAIGGKNERGNLVAGSYDTNTQMTMLEGNITKYCKERATPDNPVKLEVKATLWNGGGGSAYIATEIQMIVTHGDKEITNDTLNGVRKAAINKMEYDFYKSAFSRKFTPAQSTWDALKQRALEEG